MANRYYKGSLLDCVQDLPVLFSHPDSELLKKWLPPLTWQGFAIYLGWILLQAILFAFVPGTPTYGQITPTGHKLLYNINGFRCYIISHILFYLATYTFKLFKPTIIYDYYYDMFIPANLCGYGLSLFSWIKAHVAPTNSDCKFSGNALYDWWMGIELHPRIGNFDIKLFLNSRPGMSGWGFVAWSFAAKQYELNHYISNSTILVYIFYQIYIIDFLWAEDWYLDTIDIKHDHLGTYLCWGDCVWVGYAYSVQIQYLLGVDPIDWTIAQALAIMALNLTGIAIFRYANNQKRYFREANGNYNIMGKKATYLRTKYKLADGTVHESLLLTSGFWGIARHFNYVGDLTMSLSWGLACGITNILPHFYLLYMTLLLLHRIHRDEKRLEAKYSNDWKKFCELVPYKILPGIY